MIIIRGQNLEYKAKKFNDRLNFQQTVPVDNDVQFGHLESIYVYFGEYKCGLYIGIIVNGIKVCCLTNTDSGT